MLVIASVFVCLCHVILAQRGQQEVVCNKEHCPAKHCSLRFSFSVNDVTPVGRQRGGKTKEKRLRFGLKRPNP